MIIEFPKSDVLPDKLFWHFLRGFLDGNGSINERYISFTSTDIFNKYLAQKLANLGIDSNLYYRYKNTCTCSLMICKQEYIKKILKLLYNNATIYLQRKYDKYLKLTNK